jgi:hypothetical protein
MAAQQLNVSAAIVSALANRMDMIVVAIQQRYAAATPRAFTLLRFAYLLGVGLGIAAS